VFGIEEHYKAKLCGHNEGKAWLVQIIEEATNVLMRDSDKSQLAVDELPASDRFAFASRPS